VNGSLHGTLRTPRLPAMKPTKNIAVLIETSRAYGRGLLRGVSRFHREHRTWSITFKPEDRGTRLQRWLKTWRGDGILVRVGTPAMAAAVAALHRPPWRKPSAGNAGLWLRQRSYLPLGF
jgi:hypothetical protein